MSINSFPNDKDLARPSSKSKSIPSSRQSNNVHVYNISMNTTSFKNKVVSSSPTNLDQNLFDELPQTSFSKSLTPVIKGFDEENGKMLIQFDDDLQSTTTKSSLMPLTLLLSEATAASSSSVAASTKPSMSPTFLENNIRPSSPTFILSKKASPTTAKPVSYVLENDESTANHELNEFDNSLFLVSKGYQIQKQLPNQKKENNMISNEKEKITSLEMTSSSSLNGLNPIYSTSKSLVQVQIPLPVRRALLRKSNKQGQNFLRNKNKIEDDNIDEDVGPVNRVEPLKEKELYKGSVLDEAEDPGSNNILANSSSFDSVSGNDSAIEFGDSSIDFDSSIISMKSSLDSVKLTKIEDQLGFEKHQYQYSNSNRDTSKKVPLGLRHHSHSRSNSSPLKNTRFIMNVDSSELSSSTHIGIGPIYDASRKAKGSKLSIYKSTSSSLFSSSSALSQNFEGPGPEMDSIVQNSAYNKLLQGSDPDRRHMNTNRFSNHHVVIARVAVGDDRSVSGDGDSIGSRSTIFSNGRDEAGSSYSSQSLSIISSVLCSVRNAADSDSSLVSNEQMEGKDCNSKAEAEIGYQIKNKLLGKALKLYFYLDTVSN